MADAARWGQVVSLIDNAAARTEPTEDSAYVQNIGKGFAKPRGFKDMTMPSDTEPYVVWILVVGSIVGLVVLSKMFRSAKA